MQICPVFAGLVTLHDTTFIWSHDLLFDHMIQVSLLSYNDDGQLEVSSVIPMIDGGTEG